MPDRLSTSRRYCYSQLRIRTSVAFSWLSLWLWRLQPINSHELLLAQKVPERGAAGLREEPCEVLNVKGVGGPGDDGGIALENPGQDRQLRRDVVAPRDVGDNGVAEDRVAVLGIPPGPL